MCLAYKCPCRGMMMREADKQRAEHDSKPECYIANSAAAYAADGKPQATGS
jgi:hypothetical protein